MADKNLTYQELSVRLGVPVGTLRIWKMQGKLKCVKFGRLVRFPEAYVLNLEQKGLSDHEN